MLRQMLLLSGVLLLAGCAWPVRDATDQTVRDLVEHPFDISPEPTKEVRKPASDEKPKANTPAPPGEAQPKPDLTARPRSPESSRTDRTDPTDRTAHSDLPRAVPAEIKTAALMERHAAEARPEPPLRDGLVETVAWTTSQPQPGSSPPDAGAAQPEPPRQERREQLPKPRKLELQIPEKLPGSEAPRIPALSKDVSKRTQEIAAIYPELPPLPVEPKPKAGPDGKPYTLEDLQRLAAANNPRLVQAAADVETARGNMIQAGTYPNPTLSYLNDPTNVNNSAAAVGGSLEQIIITGGKLRLAQAAAQKDLDNAILALKRARSDLSTAVRTAYFTVLVDVETLIVSRALVQFSDDIYRLQVELLRAMPFAVYEPTALLAQTYINRLAYKQAIASYMYDWKALAATLGLPQLPLSQIAGQVDRFIPYYDFDEVRAHILRSHTDILTARNGVRKAQYLLKLAQITPIPNLDVVGSYEKVFATPPFGSYQQVTIGIPTPLWDQNKGNIIGAQGALVRAGEESHRVEVTLTSSLATAYQGYRNNLYAMEYYRRDILPDLVRYYRGVFARRQIDPSAAFGDLVFAQQNLTTNVVSYLELLGSMWSSVVSVADFLQTDDLYQLGKKRELPELPDFKQMLPPRWECGHDTIAAAVAQGAGLPPSEATLRVPPGPGGSAMGPPPDQAGASGAGENTARVTPEAPIVPMPPWMDQDPARWPRPRGDGCVQTVAWTQAQPSPTGPVPTPRKLELSISPRIPGSEAPRVVISREEKERARQIDAIFPEPPPLPVEPKVQPGPGGKPYTLADFQRLATENSPTLRQAASDVEAARGALIQAMTYPNPTFTYMDISSNNGNSSVAMGGSVDQVIIMGGKQKLGSAAAAKSLDNAVLALKRARSDLSTAVRTAYFTVLVDVETLAITRAVARFSEEIYRLQVGLLRAIQAAPYEPTALRAQAYTNRLAYKQAIASYIYDWKALVATLGLPHLPLSEIAGRVDRFFPYYDYDDIRAYMLEHHTDILTARNGVRIAQYNLKLAQLTPLFPDLDVNLLINKDFGMPPHGTYQDARMTFALPIWDQNKGNIIAAQGALVRAAEESHRVEVTLTNSLALAYQGYRNNLYSIEYYRRNILPDLVRYYRGIFARRQIDPSAAFGDLVFAQQNLSSNVTTYIGVLGALWSSVVSVADFLQTDDLFQLGKQEKLPELPDFSQPPQWVCGHDILAESVGASASSTVRGTLVRTDGSAASRPSDAAREKAKQKAADTPPAAAGAGAAPPPQNRAGQSL